MSEGVSMALVVLPFPPSVNAIWRNAGGRTYRTPEYKKWRDDAYAAYLQQSKATRNPVKGHFTYHVILDDKRRKPNMDGDNYASKAVLDFLQYVGLIDNDALADAGSWSWGPTDPGMCMVSVFQKGLQAA